MIVAAPLGLKAFAPWLRAFIDFASFASFDVLGDSSTMF
jgi:hypothetical protein